MTLKGKDSDSHFNILSRERSFTGLARRYRSAAKSASADPFGVLSKQHVQVTLATTATEYYVLLCSYTINLFVLLHGSELKHGHIRPQ